MKKLTCGIMLLGAILMSCSQNEMLNNVSSESVETRAQQTMISEAESAGILKDLTEKTVWRLNRSGVSNYSSVFEDASLLTKNSDLYLMTRPVYTMDSLMFMKFTAEQDLSQCLKREDNLLVCFLCQKKMVLNYAIYERVDVSKWTCAGLLHLRQGEGALPAYLDNLVMSNENLFLYIRPSFLDKAIRNASDEKWARIFLDRLVYLNEANQYEVFSGRRVVSKDSPSVIEEVIRGVYFNQVIASEVHDVKYPRVFLIE
ncbi:MAG: hypothetical protein K6F98_00910 [Bacteroidales bacterium]|nr:hypothetical protein [Bacteroidales bacterium]